MRSDQIERYQHHITLKEIGGAGQQSLLKARVLVVGAGGLGASLLSYLVAAGVGNIGVIDDDIITLSNLQRQILFTTDDLNKAKVEVVQERLTALNPDCTITPHKERLTANNALTLIKDYDIVADGCDNFATRFLVNDACYFARKPLVSCAVAGFEGQLATFTPFRQQKDGTPYPCYRSLVPAQEEEKDCQSDGIIGTLTGVMGSLQAMEVIKEITQSGESLAGKLLLYNALTATTRLITLTWDAANPLNGTNPRYHDLSHHS